MAFVRTVNVPASGSVQNITIPGLRGVVFDTVELLKLDNTDELWARFDGRTFTAAGDDDVNCIPAAAYGGQFRVNRPDVVTGDDLVIPVLYTTGGRVQVWGTS